MSSAVDDDVAQTVAEGRQHLGSFLRAGQKHLQKVFIVFVIGFMGTFSLLRLYIWEILRRDLNAHPDIVVVAITPFEVILLQAKIGLVAGVLLALPALAYFGRDSLKERGRWPENLPRWKLAAFVLIAALLFAGGVAYAYKLFFPLMFSFLAGNAMAAGFQPTYSIAMWAQFIFLLSMSFGLAAQLPLVMSSLSYTGIVPYETFRDKWKYAVLAIFVFGALFSPPDPFTQIMWAVPLVVLYGISLYVSKILVTTKRSSDSIDVPGTIRDRWNVLAGLLFVGAAATFAFYTYGGVEAVNEGLATVGSSYRFLPAEEAYGLGRDVYVGVAAAFYGLLAGLAGLAYLVYDGLEEPEGDRYAVADSAGGDPAEIDLSELDEAGIRAAPAAAFVRLDEDEAVELASQAMNDDDPERAQAILDRFDDAQPPEEDVSPNDFHYPEADDETAASGGSGVDVEPDEGASEDEDDDSGILARRGAGILGAFSEDDVDEDDIGGYAYDIAFVAESLTSKSFRLVGIFMAVMAATFVGLYQGGIAVLHGQFVSRMPDQFTAEQVSIVTLHPVEALIFMIKVSVILGAAATLPLVLYYAWPSLKERGFARGDRRVLLVWGGSLLTAMTVGSVLGFIYVAPTVISWLATDVLNAEMIIAYRVNNYGWLVFFLTVGIGILSMIPISMLLFHAGGIVPYRSMRNRWREFTIAVLAVGAFFSPRGVFTMFLLGVPVVAAYGLGLGLLWVITLGGRRSHDPAEPAD
ncbi:twin-arginine translocase subunit TatC [Natronomonas salina]|uniref:twin-arginine translocase subunit TatC n=1 Tax=Natronomonas salina TaxID=1710540 RepID=UPI0015B685B6|nr:twin-arginine translocase subunit TatC [Natronomonas salina]QLD89897.1 twin-arginine translocase subunit TatC [Natronomonas salina]